MFVFSEVSPVWTHWELHLSKYSEDCSLNSLPVNPMFLSTRFCLEVFRTDKEYSPSMLKQNQKHSSSIAFANWNSFCCIRLVELSSLSLFYRTQQWRIWLALACKWQREWNIWQAKSLSIEIWQQEIVCK